MFCILLSDLRLSLWLWAMHVVKEKKIVYFSGLFKVWLAFHVCCFFFTYGYYNPNREKDSV